MDPDPEAARAFFRDKPRALVNKVMSRRARPCRGFVHDGDYLASGGFGTNRIATAVLHEILRQKKRNLGFAGHTTTHDFQILAAGNLDGEQAAGPRRRLLHRRPGGARALAARPARDAERRRSRSASGRNYALACRFRAAAMGVPFLPVRTMLGTDTFGRSAAKDDRLPLHRAAAGRRAGALSRRGR